MRLKSKVKMTWYLLTNNLGSNVITVLSIPFKVVLAFLGQPKASKV